MRCRPRFGADDLAPLPCHDCGHPDWRRFNLGRLPDQTGNATIIAAPVPLSRAYKEEIVSDTGLANMGGDVAWRLGYGVLAGASVWAFKWMTCEKRVWETSPKTPGIAAISSRYRRSLHWRKQEIQPSHKKVSGAAGKSQHQKSRRR